MSVISMKQLTGSRRTFRPPDKKMEPQNGSVHLHREKWYLHHRSSEVRRQGRRGLQGRIADIAADGGTILFVGTKKQAQDAIKTEAERCGMFYVNERWLGGMLTNFKTIQSQYRKIESDRDHG